MVDGVSKRAIIFLIVYQALCLPFAFARLIIERLFSKAKTMHTIEYLIIIEKKSSPALFGLCDSIRAFNKFLQTEDDISIERNKKIRHSSTDALLGYQVEMGQVRGKNQRFFHVRVAVDEPDSISSLVTLARTIKRVVVDGGGQIETLWDDVSLFYSHKAYPHIHRIENLMRKLITYFMLTSVGKEWVITASPEAVRRQIDSKQKQYIDALFQVDFIHLGDFLFKAYASKNIQELYDLIEDQDGLVDITANEILEFKARSNWDRYFSEFVECEATFLDKRWKQLYELRCDIAHNKLFGRADYDSVIRLVEEVGPFLQKALEGANRVEVSKEDKEQIAESVAGSINKAFGEFIETWKLLEIKLKKAISQSSHELPATNLSLSKILQILQKEGELDVLIAQKIKDLMKMRNSIVHEATSGLTSAEVDEGVKQIKFLIDSIPIIDQPVSFHAECIKRIENHLKIKFNKKSTSTYLAEEEAIALTCNISKLQERKPPYYWFGFYQRQLDFLQKTKKSFAAFGCGSANTILLIPSDWLFNYFENCSVTKTPKFYWHIQIIFKDGRYLLYQRDGNHVDLSGFLLE